MRGSAYYGLLSLKLTDRDAEAALDLAERMKARRLSDVLAAGHAHITQAMSPAEKERERKLSREVARLNQAMAGTGASNPKVKSDFGTASRALEGFRAELYSAHPELQVHRGDALPVRVPELRDLLPDTHTLLIEFASLDDKIAIFTVERGVDGQPKLGLHQITADTDLVAGRVGQYRDSLASRDPEYRAAAQKLYRMLLAPAAAQLAGKSNVVIVPDGPLWNLPFHALVDESGRHLIERFAVSYAPSLTVLRESLHSRPVNGKLLAIGSPRGDLPNAAAEARELGRLYGQESSVLTGKDATDARWREAAPQSSILHLATHGILNSAKPMFSYLEL